MSNSVSSPLSIPWASLGSQAFSDLPLEDICLATYNPGTASDLCYRGECLSNEIYAQSRNLGPGAAHLMMAEHFSCYPVHSSISLP